MHETTRFEGVVTQYHVAEGLGYTQPKRADFLALQAMALETQHGETRIRHLCASEGDLRFLFDGKLLVVWFGDIGHGTVQAHYFTSRRNWIAGYFQVLPRRHGTRWERYIRFRDWPGEVDHRLYGKLRRYLLSVRWEQRWNETEFSNSAHAPPWKPIYWGKAFA